jgi:hypothetical protein
MRGLQEVQPSSKRTIRVALSRPTIAYASLAWSRSGHVEYRHLDRGDRVVVGEPRLVSFQRCVVAAQRDGCHSAIGNEGFSLNLLRARLGIAGLGRDVLDACKQRHGRGVGVAPARRSSRTSARPGVRRPALQRRLVTTVCSLFAYCDRSPIGLPGRSNPRHCYHRFGFCVDLSRRRRGKSRPGLRSGLPTRSDRWTARDVGR